MELIGILFLKLYIIGHICSMPSKIMQISTPLPSVSKAIAVTNDITFSTNEGDTRLDHSVTVHEAAAPLRDILLQLQQKCGAKLQIAEDWIANLPTTAFTKATPIHNILRSIAHLHNLTWRRAVTQEPGAIPAYVLYESPSNRRYLTYLRELSWQPLRDWYVQLRHYLTLGHDDLVKLANSGDADAAWLCNDINYDCALLSCCISDKDLESMIHGRTFTLSFIDLPEQGQRALSEIVLADYEDQHHDKELMRERGIPVSDHEAPLVSPSEYSVRYYVQGVGATADVVTIAQTRQRAFSCSGLMHDGGSAATWLHQRFEAAQRQVQPALRIGNRRLSTPFKINATKWTDVLESIARKSGISVFSDAQPEWPGYDVRYRALSTEIEAQSPLAKGLNLSVHWHRVWWQEGAEGSVFLFLADDWYHLRDNMIVKTVENLRHLQSLHGKWTLEDFATLASMPDNERFAACNSLELEPMYLNSVGDLLRLYGSLTEKLRKQLANTGILGRDLPSIQRAAFGRFIDAVDADIPPDYRDSLRLRIKVERGQTTFILTPERVIPNKSVGFERTIAAVPVTSILSGTPGKMEPRYIYNFLYSASGRV